jgi:hypothetical protein
MRARFLLMGGYQGSANVVPIAVRPVLRLPVRATCGSWDHETHHILQGRPPRQPQRPLREKGLEQIANLKNRRDPVDEVVGKKMRWGAMPLEGLVTRLEEKTNKRTLRIDKEPPGPMDGKR